MSMSYVSYIVLGDIDKGRGVGSVCKAPANSFDEDSSEHYFCEVHHYLPSEAYMMYPDGDLEGCWYPPPHNLQYTSLCSWVTQRC